MEQRRVCDPSCTIRKVSRWAWMVLRGISMKVIWVILQASSQFDNIKSRFYCMNMQALE